MMTTRELDGFFRRHLEIEGIADVSLNGLQVDNDASQIAKIAFAVDASLATFTEAARLGANMVFVHHGLFWGKPLPLVGSHRARLEFLLKNNIALYACHLPLDRDRILGNNAALAELLKLESIEEFGTYHGIKIGFKGRFEKPVSTASAANRIGFMDRKPLGVYPFGKELNSTCAVVSGGAADLAGEAVREGIDLYVTGEASHEVFHLIEEEGINMIAGGHYNTEVWGVRKVMELVEHELHIASCFIDLDTRL
jgi:dinuclear metal center YbgI/SA1388 family protein